MLATVAMPRPAPAVEIDPAAGALAQELARAYWDWVGDGRVYQQLYQETLGVPSTWTPCRPPAANWAPSQDGSLERVRRAGRIRLGYYLAAPYHMLDQGQHVGFDYTIGNKLAERLELRAEWVEQPVKLPGGGDDTELAYQQLYQGLLEDRYDVVFSGVLMRTPRPVDVIAPTMRIFPLPIYTGRGQRDLAALQNANKTAFVKALSGLGKTSILCTQGGPSQRITEDLIASIRLGGGEPQLTLATPEQMVRAIQSQSVDFIIGDALALTMQTRHPQFAGLNLNIDLDPSGGELIGPFTLHPS